MVEGGIKDYAFAKRKAVARLGRYPRGQLPNNAEIEAAIAQYQRLFRDEQPVRLLALRRAALRVMRLLASFSPCWVGSVLRGTADEYSDVVLHVCSEPVEPVGTCLNDHRIPFQTGERRLRTGLNQYRCFPIYLFADHGTSIELVVFDWNTARQSPLCPVNGKPMLRAQLAQVEAIAIER